MSDDLELYREVASRTARGESVAVATVIRVRGSVPRHPGAKMAVALDGSTTGTVGGGCGEALVCRAAREAIRTGRPARLEVDLTEDEAADSGAICGGVMELFLDVFSPP